LRKRPDHPVHSPAQPSVQPPLGEEALEARQPSVLSRIFKKAGLAVLLILALAFAYIFLLLGEPDDDAKYLPKKQEETILMPMSALEIPGEANVQTMADAFGQPVLSLGQALPMHKARIYDTAFDGGYARRVTLTYTFEDGTQATAESIRPTSAVALLREKGYKLDASSLYTLGGLNAARMDNAASSCVFTQTETAVYAVLCPIDKVQDLTALLRYSTLVMPVQGM